MQVLQNSSPPSPVSPTPGMVASFPRHFGEGQSSSKRKDPRMRDPPPALMPRELEGADVQPPTTKPKHPPTSQD